MQEYYDAFTVAIICFAMIGLAVTICFIYTAIMYFLDKDSWSSDIKKHENH